MILRKVVSKAHHLPLTYQSGYSSSEEEEKVIILYIRTFPSFLKEGCHARRVMTGWLKTLLRRHLLFIIVKNS
ncbi:MAG: hypothetical protein IMZ52_09645 [Actinobacteria bacterium]|nr:hypothetical protein [Actinomycetota bacterium]